MANHHEPFTSLGPIDWEDVPQDTLPEYLEDIFAEAQTVVDSIPSTHPSHDDSSQHHQAESGRPRAQTDSAVLNAVPATTTHTPKPRTRTPAAIAQSQKLQKEWKEVKVNPRENPHDVKVYKLGSKDGKGAWFARSSLHEGLSFEQWKDGLQREFMETMKVQGQPGSGSIRGIGADKRVENHDLHDAGHVQGKTVYSERQTRGKNADDAWLQCFSCRLSSRVRRPRETSLRSSSHPMPLSRPTAMPPSRSDSS